MKKLVLSAFLCLSSTLVAQEGIIYEVEPTIGYNIFDSSSKMENDITYGIRGTAYMNGFYGYRFGYERADDIKYDVPSVTPDSQKRTNMQRISAALLINGEEEYNVIPYLFAGLGYEILSNETKTDVSQMYVDGGLGFKYMFMDNLNMNLEAKVLKKFDTSDLDYGVNFGFGYMLGGTLASNKHESDDFNDVLKNESDNKTKLEDIKPVVEKRVEKDTSSQTASSIENQAKVNTTAEVETFDDDFKRVKKSKTTANLSGKHYYVQMEAWFKGSYETLPNILSKKGYDFEIKDVIRKNKNAKIVIIGPYDSINDASKEYRTLKDIKWDAFITKI